MRKPSRSYNVKRPLEAGDGDGDVHVKNALDRAAPSGASPRIQAASAACRSANCSTP